MITFYRSDSGKLLHMVVRTSRLPEELPREELVEPDNFIQAAIIQADAGKTFKAHLHLERERQFQNLKAQESWVVLCGEVKVDFYDETGSHLGHERLGQGDISITLHGGHGYEILSGPAKIVEFKTGPYEGQAVDKRFI